MVYRRGDFGQVARALRVLDRLRGFKQGRWVSEIAADIASSERTVRRDLSELQDAGIDIEISKRANRVFAYLTEERNYSPVSITKRERFTLLAVRRVFDVFARTPFLEDVVSVLHKLEQRMSEKERSELAAFGDQFVYMPDHGTTSSMRSRRASFPASSSATNTRTRRGTRAPVTSRRSGSPCTDTASMRSAPA